MGAGYQYARQGSTEAAVPSGKYATAHGEPCGVMIEGPSQDAGDESNPPRYATREQGPNTAPNVRCRVAAMSPQRLGEEGESLAASYLRRRGWTVIQQNWICPYGEADIIAMDGDTHVLVEVKTRTAESERSVSYPELAVGPSKQRRYRNIAACYLALEGPVNVRFDIIAVTIVADRTAHIHHLVSAFGGGE